MFKAVCRLYLCNNFSYYIWNCTVVIKIHALYFDSSLCHWNWKNKNREAIATHESLLSTLTASLFSTSSLCNTRLVRSLGNLHVVAGGKDPMCCEPCDSHRQTASVTTNLSLSMGQVHLQASFLRSSQAKWRFGLHLHRSKIGNMQKEIWSLVPVQIQQKFQRLGIHVVSLQFSKKGLCHNHMMFLDWAASPTETKPNCGSFKKCFLKKLFPPTTVKILQFR